MLACLVAGCSGAADAPDTTLIVGARLIDGTGAPARSASLRFNDQGLIVAIGELELIPGERVVDAAGLVLAPGFIDTHSHHDRGLFEELQALAVVSQGITTIVVGQDGGSSHPLSAFFERLETEPPAVNVASYSGHNTLREKVMGDDPLRPATPGEVDSIKILLQNDMRAGSLGLSTGLEYDPGLYATTEEVIALAREAAAHQGRYISHMRSEDQHLWEAVDEAISVAEQANLPVQISHMKLAMKGLWGESSRLLARLDAARAAGLQITADVYPYEYWQSTMTVVFPERDFEDRSAFVFALDQVVPPDGLLLAQYVPNPSYEGRTLSDIATERGENPVDTYMHLVAESQALAAQTGQGTESVIATSMDSDDVLALLAWPHSNVSSDGALDGGHPRGFGAFPRALRVAVRETGRLSLEEAVYKMTGLGADHMGLEGRGRLAPGMAADLVLFSPERIADRATPAEPHLRSDGVERVWVNGVVVYVEGTTTDARPGRVLRGPGAVAGAVDATLGPN